MVHHNKLLELGLFSSHAEDGLLAAAGVSYYETSIYVGLVGGEILDGRDPATMAIFDSNVADVAFNLERAEMLGMKIPYQELVKATEVYQSIGSRP